MNSRGTRWESVAAAAFFAILTLALTWPLARGLTRDVPSDFGDPLLNSWILAWDASHLGGGLWNANIFYPHPLALAYSEHLVAQAVQILPVYGLTGNPILCYNLVFLSTFILSGLGMFLLVRELTGDSSAAIVGGVAFGFAPYRAASLPHLQVLSSAWMPFVLFGFRRYFVSGSMLSLTGAASAWLLQNLSCGYYLLFFSPVVLCYLAWELTTRQLWIDRRVSLPLAASIAVVFLATAPFLWPYLQLRRLGFAARSTAETVRFSADVYGYLTADPNLRFWGSVARAWPKAEGALFPGLTVVVLAAIAALRHFGKTTSLALALGAATLLALLLGYTVRLPGIKITSLPRALAVLALVGAIVLGRSTATRRAFVGWLKSAPGFFTAATLFAVIMSFGPEIQAKGRVVAPVNLYLWFYRVVPGFDGLRVPARFGMIVALGLAALAPFAVASVGPRPKRLRIAAAVSGLVLVESWVAPMPINQNATDYRQPGLASLPPTLGIGTRGMDATPTVYRYMADLPDVTAIVELPLGEPAFDVRYMLYSTRHWKRLVNGYAGGQPSDYELLNQSLQDALTRPDQAWRVLMDSGASHVILHEAFYAGDRGRRIAEWLMTSGANETARFDADRVFRIRPTAASLSR